MVSRQEHRYFGFQLASRRMPAEVLETAMRFAGCRQRGRSGAVALIQAGRQGSTAAPASQWSVATSASSSRSTVRQTEASIHRP